MTSPEEGNRGNGAGNLLLVALAGWVTWQAIGESGMQQVLGFLDSAARAHQQQLEEREAEARQQEELERQQRLERLQAAIRKIFQSPPSGLPPPPHTTLAPAVAVTTAVEPDARWRQVIIHPSVVLVLGKRGSGKSALGYRKESEMEHQVRRGGRG